MFEIAASTLADDAQPSELARRVTSHLGCELTAIVPVTERFPKWEHVNVQRGVDAYLAARQNEMAQSELAQDEMAQDEPEWFGAPGAAVPPHENLLSLLSMPARAGGVRIAGPRGIRVMGAGVAGTGAASYGTAAIGPEGNMWVSDTHNARLAEFNPSANFVRVATGTGSIEPAGLTDSPSGLIWVTDPI